MLISRRKRKENKEINIYLNNKPSQQVTTIIDNKFKFSEHISYTAERSGKLIHSLSKSPKLTWGLNHEALQTIYKGAMLPLLLYGAPVWAESMKFEYNRLRYIRVQRLTNIKIVKAFRTLSYEASCVLAGVRPIRLAIQEKVRIYKATQNNIEYDAPLEVRYWPHPPEIPLIRAPTEIQHNVINIFTDGIKIGGKAGAAAVIIKNDIILHQSTFELHERCSNNHVEQVAIVRALEQMQNLQLAEDAEKIAVANRDSKVTLDTMQNRNKHCILIEKIREEIKRLEDLRWTVFCNWVKAHVGRKGNEMADRLAKKAATEHIGEIIYDKTPRETIITERKLKGLAKWQEQWTDSTKGAVSKLFFPIIKKNEDQNTYLS